MRSTKLCRNLRPLYLDSAYPLGDFHEAGWDLTVAYEEIADQLRSDPTASERMATLLDHGGRQRLRLFPLPVGFESWRAHAEGREEPLKMPLRHTAADRVAQARSGAA